MINLKEVERQCLKKQTLHGVNIFTLFPHQLNKVIDIVFEQCKHELQTHSDMNWQYPWLSIPTAKKRKVYHHKPIPRLANVVNVILSNLSKTHQIDVRHTKSRGPYYTYFVAKKYRYKTDWICIPEPERFILAKDYYKTLLHEMSHAACSRTRLCLKFMKDEEEIGVEASALIICFLSGYNLWESCLGYMTNWSYDKNKKLCLSTKAQWEGIKSKTKRIVRYLLYGTDRI
jgi:hypothetical protein